MSVKYDDMTWEFVRVIHTGTMHRFKITLTFVDFS